MSYPPFQPAGQPQQPNYYGGGQQPHVPGYPPSQQIGFNVNPAHYPQQPAYPTNPQPGYAPQPGYTPQPGYAQQPGYPPQPGYPTPPQQPAYPSPSQPAYPTYPDAQQPSYGAQPAYHPSMPSQPGQQGYGYPQQQSAYAGSGGPTYQQPASGQQIPTLSHGSVNVASGYPNLNTAPQYPNVAPSSNQSFGAGSGFNHGAQAQFATNQYSQPSPAMPMYQGTVKAYGNFSANLDAEALRKAMKGFGCDDKAVLNILCYRSNAQRQQIRQTFKAMYGKDLIEQLVSELKGNFEDLVVALMYSPAEFDSRELEHAMKGIGTNETTLIEIMTTRTNAEIQAINTAYKMMFRRDLEQVLQSETSGYFRRMLISLCVGARDESNHVDRTRAAQQAKDLHAAGEKCWGTDESQFNATMIMTNPAQLQLVFEEYRRETGRDVEQAVRAEFSGDILDGLLTLVKLAKNRPAFFAERANVAMKGMGTRDRDLIRVVASRAEVEMVQIKQEYQSMFNASLEKDIQGDTSGSYKNGLLALIGAA